VSLTSHLADNETGGTLPRGIAGNPGGENAMDKDRIKGAAKQVKGSVKEAIGKVTGNIALLF
jgi:hypothetical protein